MLQLKGQSFQEENADHLMRSVIFITMYMNGKKEAKYIRVVISI